MRTSQLLILLASASTTAFALAGTADAIEDHQIAARVTDASSTATGWQPRSADPAPSRVLRADAATGSSISLGTIGSSQPDAPVIADPSISIFDSLPFTTGDRLHDDLAVFCDGPITVGVAPCCPQGPRFVVFGEYLLLRPGNDKVSYAVPIDGAIVPPVGAPPVQIGPEAVVNANYSSGLRLGADWAFSPSAVLGISYSWLDSSDQSAVRINAPFVLRSLVTQPGTQAAPSDFLEASADLGVNFHLADVYASRPLVCGDAYTVNMLIGARFGSLEQTFQSVHRNSTTVEIVQSRTEFDGGGVRLGLTATSGLGLCGADCSTGCMSCGVAAGSGWRLYGRAMASFLAGKFRTAYTQSINFAASPVVFTGWEDERIVPILDIEFGVSWTGPRERLHLSAGYLLSAWYNSVTTEPFIRGVRTNYSGEIRDALTFDGLVARAEWRF